MNRLIPILAALVCAGVLCACGGGGDDGPAPPPPAPPAPAANEAIADGASQSATGLVAYLSALFKLDSETKEPFDLGAFKPVQPDDGEPEPLT